MVYIIGNGFDIAHKFPTSYWHFREYLEDMHQDFLADFEYLYNIGRIDLSDPRVSERTVSKRKKLYATRCGVILKTKWVDLVDYLSRIYKDTAAIVSFNNYFWNKLHNVNSVEIIGWSVGEIDLLYLREIRDDVDISTVFLIYGG